MGNENKVVPTISELAQDLAAAIDELERLLAESEHEPELADSAVLFDEKGAVDNRMVMIDKKHHDYERIYVNNLEAIKPDDEDPDDSTEEEKQKLQEKLSGLDNEKTKREVHIAIPPATPQSKKVFLQRVSSSNPVDTTRKNSNSENPQHITRSVDTHQESIRSLDANLDRYSKQVNNQWFSRYRRGVIKKDLLIKKLNGVRGSLKNDEIDNALTQLKNLKDELDKTFGKTNWTGSPSKAYQLVEAIEKRIEDDKWRPAHGGLTP